MSQKKIKRKIFTVVGFIALLVGLFVLTFSGENKVLLQRIFSGDYSFVDILNQCQFLGWQGVVVDVVLSMLQVVLTFLPAEPIQVLAGLSFGFWQGLLVCCVGTFLGNTLLYVFYKVYGDRLQDYFQKNIKVDFEALRQSKRIVLVIFLLYFAPAIPYGLICFFTASLGNKYPKYIILTTLGAIPSVAIGVGLGHIATAFSWITSLLIFVAIAILIIVLYFNREKVFAWLTRFAQKNIVYTSKTKVHNPNKRIAKFLLRQVKRYAKRKVKLEVVSSVDKIQDRSVVLCNHSALLDFAMFTSVINRADIHIVANRQYFFSKTLGRILKYLGCIPKSMLAVDVENVRNCLSVVKNDGVLVLCPEARFSTVGKLEDIQPGTMGFLRKLNANVYVINFKGNYLAMPKWARTQGKGYLRKNSLVQAYVSQLYKEGESMQCDEQQFEQTVTQALQYNDFEWLSQHEELSYPQKNLAQGLQNILYKCPVCNSQDGLETKGNDIVCPHCGNVVTMDDRYQFDDKCKFDNLQQWYDWQMDCLRSEITQDANYQLQDANVALWHASNTGKTQLTQAGKGKCVLNREGLTYVGTDNGQQVQKHFPISQIYRLLFGADEDFEIYEGEQIWYFVPNDKRTCVRWYMASIILKELCSN